MRRDIAARLATLLGVAAIVGASAITYGFFDGPMDSEILSIALRVGIVYVIFGSLSVLVHASMHHVGTEHLLTVSLLGAVLLGALTLLLTAIGVWENWPFSAAQQFTITLGVAFPFAFGTASRNRVHTATAMLAFLGLILLNAHFVYVDIGGPLLKLWDGAYFSFGAFLLGVPLFAVGRELGRTGEHSGTQS